MPFKIGDIVQIKSGGPKMTVVGIVKHHDVFDEHQEPNSYRTSWFAGAKLEHGTFPEDALVHGNDEKEKMV